MISISLNIENEKGEVEEEESSDDCIESVVTGRE